MWTKCGQKYRRESKNVNHFSFYEAMYLMDIKGIHIRNQNVSLGNPEGKIECVEFQIVVSLPF